MYSSVEDERDPEGPWRRTFAARLTLDLAAQDWLMLVYLLVLFVEVVVGSAPQRPTALRLLGADIIGFAAVLWLVRGGALGGFAGALLYRLGVLGALLASFFELQWILPAASRPPLDAQLHALDLRLFGVEPAVAWDRIVTPATTEWFSFFYYAYFPLLAAHVLPALFFERRPRLVGAFGFGVLWLYCVGHVVYTFVPAFGPYAHLGFSHELVGARWWPLVQETVASVDERARSDVFPSLHTAGPWFLTLFSFANRRHAPFRFTWLPLGLVATQITIATMFLRWHYLVDVCAGLLLAASALAAGRVAVWWDEGRAAGGGRVAWPPLELRKSRHHRSATRLGA